MHPTEPKNAFLIMRANGWSLGRISNQLQIPKSTLFNWESDAVTRRTIKVIKSLQVEKLQEKYIPSFEEELQKLSACLTRVEGALEKQNFEGMRPEFLLRTSLQLRSRLHKFRSDVQPTRTLDEGELPVVPGCISRSQSEIPDSDAANVGSAKSSPSPLWPLWGEGRGEVPSDGGLDEVSAPQNGTNRDENKNCSQTNHSDPATSANQNGTIVPFSETPRPSENPLPQTPIDRNNHSVTPHPFAPAPREELSLTAGFTPKPSRPSCPATTTGRVPTPVPTKERERS